MVPERLKPHVPNLLTASRGIAGLVILGLYNALGYESMWMRLGCLVLFVAAAATDFLDGYLSKVWNAASLLGEILDPVCDKLLMWSAFYILWEEGPPLLPLRWLVILFVAVGIYDVGTILLRLIKVYGQYAGFVLGMRTSDIAKSRTFFLMGVLCYFLLFELVSPFLEPVRVASWALTLNASLLGAFGWTCYSAYEYLFSLRFEWTHPNQHA